MHCCNLDKTHLDEIQFDSDFSVIKDSIPIFLKECSEALETLTCIYAREGSIIVTVGAATPDDLETGISHVHENDLTLPSWKESFVVLVESNLL